MKRARRHLTGDEYDSALRAHAPAALMEEIRAEIDRAEEPENET
ncbi:hypothetical protein FMEAI12_5360007 [Parafrankia sp. Ea1.12]|nr:hypothetical protein FMEAI12_5360007 [Parafrankia sp. Ea1.12]